MSIAQRVIIFDTETTGLSPAMGDRIVEIGAVEMVGYEVLRTFHRYINPQRDVPEEVVRVHGLSGHFLSDKPLFSHVCDELLEFFGEDVIVAHNAEFDRGFLNAELERCGRTAFARDRFEDTLDTARGVMRAGARLSLDGLAKHFRLDQKFDLSARKGPGGHGALLDAKMLAEIYINLKGGRQQALFAEEAGSVSSETVVVVRAPARPRIAPMHLLSTLEERALHEDFVGKLPGGNLWTADAA